jgi:CIC family chloride channel protein
VLFTLEVILQDFSIRTFTPLVISSFIANVTTRAIFARIEGSEYPAIFAMPAQASANAPTIVDWAQAGNFVLLGLICGVAGVMLTKLMGVFETRFRKLNLSSALKPALGGALLGVLGIAYVLILGRVLLHQPKPFAFEQYPMPAFFSDGYGVIQNLLRGEFYVHWDAGKIVLLLAFLSLAKILATCLTLGSGGSGGIIAPSLFIGATAGGCLGMVLQQTHWFGALHPEVYALVGMGAVLAAVVHAPLASIIILFELTADYRVTLPAMITTVTAVGIARLMFPDSIYTHTLRMRGIKWGSASDLSVLRRMNVEQVELEPATVLQVSEPVQKALDLAAQLGSANFVATDAEGTYQGMVVTDQLNQALIERDVVPLTIVGDVMRSDIPPVKNTDDLATVFEMFCQTEMAYLPVCLASRPGKVIGLISRNALMRTYQGQWAGGERSG